jgi:hypothetical protein
MNDIAASLLYVLRDEAETFWCFARRMESAEPLFTMVRPRATLVLDGGWGGWAAASGRRLGHFAGSTIGLVAGAGSRRHAGQAFSALQFGEICGPGAHGAPGSKSIWGLPLLFSLAPGQLQARVQSGRCAARLGGPAGFVRSTLSRTFRSHSQCAEACADALGSGQVVWSEHLSQHFELFICVAMLQTVRDEILQQQLGLADILDVSRSTTPLGGMLAAAVWEV